ncbi:MAG TPA: DNA alkylation repair protein [Fibrobacter sp.]|nr:DNA alkylation repair protein [Fibrobacter sp.]
MLKFTQEILLALRAIANDDEARSMSRTVKEQFDFLGVKVVSRREATYPIFEKFPPKDSEELIRRVDDMWSQPYREIQYAACDYLFRHKDLLAGPHLNFLKKLIKTRAWRDTVDTLATSVLGDLAWRMPALRSKIASWIRDPNIWVRRSAIIFQLQYRDQTDWPLLKEFCVSCAKDEDFYIRNGIGRALSEYARINPIEVRRFVLSNTLSFQMTQEILKNI